MLDLVGVGSFGMDVFFGRTDGGLSQPTVYPLSGFGALVAVGDLNGDGRADLVLADPLVIYLNDGTGGFLPGGTIATAAAVKSIAIGDLNADGFLDLVVGEQGSRARTTTTRSTSTLAVPGDPFQVRWPSLVSRGCRRVIGTAGPGGRPPMVTDLLDLVANVYDPSQIYAQPQLAVLLNQGDGGFVLTSYAVPFTGFALLPQRDRVPDLLLTNGNPDALSYIQVMENTCADLFQLGRAYSIGGTSTTIGDFNGDCVPDIAASLWTPSEAAGPGEFYGDGKGGFSDPQALADVLEWPDRACTVRTCRQPTGARGG